MKNYLKSLRFIILLSAVLTIGGCSSSRYMLDDPVNDPTMTLDDQQDDDLCKVEDGGFSGASGDCPT